MMKQLKHLLELKKKEQRCHQQEEKQPIQVVTLIFERVVVLFLHTSKSGACIFLSNYYDVIKELFFYKPTLSKALLSHSFFRRVTYRAT